MNRRELLELAALATGRTLRWFATNDGEYATVVYTPEESALRNGVDGYHWDPLSDTPTDPAAALRGLIVQVAANIGLTKK